MKVKEPNIFLYILMYILFYPFLKICFALKVDKSRLKMPDGPYIVLSNHATLYDFLVVMLSLFPRRLNAITAHKFFLFSPLHKILPAMGCIPKNMFDPDVRSIIGIKQVLKRGGGILLFPEGRCSVYNEFSNIHKSTGKLLKKLAVPVISSRLDGANTCAPLWRNGARYGHLRVTHQNLFSAEDLASMSIDEINSAVVARLSGPDASDPPHPPYKTFFARRLAAGLHRILYHCPFCGSDYATQSKGNNVFCTNCGFEAALDKEGKLHLLSTGNDIDGNPQNNPFAGSDSSEGSRSDIIEIADWISLEKEREMQALSEDMQPIEFDVKVKLPAGKPGRGVVYSGSGTMRIDPKGWHFDGTLRGEQTSLLFPIDAIAAITFDYDKNIQITYEGVYHVFKPEDPRKCIQYTIIAECLHRKFATNPMLT